LADIFVSMAKANQRVLVETHSEHLLLRLRRLVAERRIDADQIAIYYIEKKDGCSVVRQIDMRDNGNVPSSDWPKGFFEDTLHESLALAQAQARRT
jgi:predicted ATPase